MPLIAMLVAGYGSWQDNQTVLRVSYIINGVLYVIYQIIISAYIVMTFEAVSLIGAIFSLIYYSILKKETPVLKAIFKKREKETTKTSINNS